MSLSTPRLFTPGPTEIPAAVQTEMARPMIHHRTAEFETIFANARTSLARIYQTQNDVLILASSGSGAMDAAVCNFFSTGDTVIVARDGKFGERWVDIAKAYGLNVIDLVYAEGTPIDANDIKTQLTKNSDIKGVLFQASETSTGTYHPVKEIAAVVNANSDAITVVDAITAIGIHDIKTDDWQLDVVVAGSQKGFMLPPGLSFISVSKRAWQQAEKSTLPKFYLNLAAELKAQQKNTTEFTSAVSLIRGLDKSCELILADGLQKVFAKHQQMMRAIHAAADALNLKLVAERSPSHCLTAIYIPENIGAGKVKKMMEQEDGITIAGGQGVLKGKIIRISHFGVLTRMDIIAVVASLEKSLSALGYIQTPGAAVQAALEVFMENK